jgi:hypothetical protein
VYGATPPVGVTISVPVEDEHAAGIAEKLVLMLLTGGTVTVLVIEQPEASVTL